MNFKDEGIITVDKIKKKKIKCHKFHYDPLGRDLMVHEDINNKNYTAISDFSSGYKFFQIQTNPNMINFNEITEKLKKYTKHFTLEGIKEEISRLQNQELQLKERNNK